MESRFGHPPRFIQCGLAVVVGLTFAVAANATTPNALLGHYSAQAGDTPQVERGRQLFTQGHGREWRCASCHHEHPTTPGKHASTGKVIQPLAPSVNLERFTDEAKAEKWFKRNCNDVLGRVCTPQEKADVLAWLIQLKP